MRFVLRTTEHGGVNYFCVHNILLYLSAMSRFAGKKSKRGPGAEFTWDTDPGGEPDTAPTPLYPVRFVYLQLFLPFFCYVT